MSDFSFIGHGGIVTKRLRCLIKSPLNSILKGELHVKSRLRRYASGYIERSNQFFTF
ncbi:hypothetical protein [Brevibacillus sp. SKDU10]|uniref:hypothetical protein n=1 Tax=Brevibacillus sp. SKDU10 TaxID=1247872 RepID=UPI0012FCB4FB|nr:hypothetical protein [Brevibacillus sp. SKDU10]